MPSGIYKRTEECKKNLSKSHLGKASWNEGKKTGQIPWNKGKPQTKETKEKNRLAHLGKYLSEEHKRKIGLAGLGRHNTKKTIEKMRIAHSRESLSEETLEKMRIANLGKDNPNYGKKCSEETKKKMSRTHKKLSHTLSSYFQKGNIPWNKDKKSCFTKEVIKKILRRRAPSSLEEKFQSIVDKHNLPYKYVGDGSFIIGRYNPDFINTNCKKIAIEVYARYYKRRNHISIEDWKIQRAKVFRQYGWQVIYFDEIEVNEENILNKL